MGFLKRTCLRLNFSERLIIKFDDFIGTWHLAGFKLVNETGTESKPWLEGSKGMLLYGTDGYMSAIISIIDKTGGKPKHLAYCGPFEVEHDRVIHHVDMSSEAQLVGQAQTRLTDLNDGILTLTSSPSIYGGIKSKALLSWKRTKPGTGKSSSIIKRLPTS